MEWTERYTIKTSFLNLHLEGKEIGDDLLLVVSGGEAHIGCMVVAIPRPSLREDGGNSCTSSVFNLTGHKDEEVCRRIAEAYCKMTGKLVVCTGGIHVGQMQPSQIKELISEVNNFIQTKNKRSSRKDIK